MNTPSRILTWSMALAAVTLPPRVAAAQTDARLEPEEASAVLAPGAEVRVQWFDRYSTVSAFPRLRSATLDLVRLDPSHLLGRRGEQMYIIETGALRSVQRRIGTRPASAPAMVAGSAGGFAVAFLVAALGARSEGGAVDAGLSAGVLVGAPAGALVAWLASRSRGIYESVRVPGAGSS